MDNEILKTLAKELASKVNAAVNIPLVKEEDEQALFEIIILMVMEILLGKLGFRYKVEK